MPLTLNRNNRFLNAYKRGKCFVSPILITYIIKNKNKRNLLGITASKKVGNAVKRNRARRIISAAFSEYENKIDVGYDIVFVARAKTTEVKTQDISKIMCKHLAMLNLDIQ